MTVAEGFIRHGRLHLVHGVISTDDILPARHKHRTVDPVELGQRIFEHVAPTLRAQLQPGDGLLADSAFGIGSSREQAVSALQAAGVSFVIAPRFGRIFFRNAWNLSLAAVEARGVTARDGDEAWLDLANGRLRIHDRCWDIPRVDPHLLAQLERGGLLASLKAELAGR